MGEKLSQEELTLEKRIASSMLETAKSIQKNAEEIEKGNPQIKEMVNEVMRVYGTPHRVFTMGEGKSGSVARGFAMRLMQIGFNAFVIGETITPSIEKEDVVVVVSGSGTTKTNITRCQAILEKVGATIIAITSYIDSPLGRLADIKIKILGREEMLPADYFERSLIGERPLPPLRTLFETNAEVFLDSVIIELMSLTKTTEEEMKKRHADL